jgi:hypothetical protein
MVVDIVLLLNFCCKFLLPEFLLVLQISKTNSLKTMAASRRADA